MVFNKTESIIPTTLARITPICYQTTVLQEEREEVDKSSIISGMKFGKNVILIHLFLYPERTRPGANENKRTLGYPL